MGKKLFFLLQLFFFCGKIFSQDNRLDSVTNLFLTAKSDTEKTKCLIELTGFAPDGEWQKYNALLGEICKKNVPLSNGKSQTIFLKGLATSLNNEASIYQDQGDYKKAIPYLLQSKEIQQKTGDKKGLALSLANLGSSERHLGNTTGAMDYYSKSLSMMMETNYTEGEALVTQNLGSLNEDIGNLSGAMEYYLRSIKLWEKAGDSSGVAVCLNNLALLYSNQGDKEKAMELFTKCIQMLDKKNDKRRIAVINSNIAGLIMDKGKKTANRELVADALDKYLESLKLYEECADQDGIALAYHNIASVYEYFGLNLGETNQIKKGEEYYLKAYQLREKLGNKLGMVMTLKNLGEMNTRLKNYSKAEEFLLKAFSVSREIKALIPASRASLALSKLYKLTNRFDKALKMYETHIQLKDSLLNEQTKKASIKTQLKYEYEKKAAADSVKNAEQQKVKDAQLAAQTASLKQEKFQRYSLVVGLSLVVCGLLFVINRFRITQKQKKIIEEQKIKVDEAFEKLHEKNKEVMDSIYYARRIQRALITNEKYFTRNLDRLNN